MWPFSKNESEEDLLRELVQGMNNFLSAVNNSSAPPKVKEILNRDIPRNIEWVNNYLQSLRTGGNKQPKPNAHQGIASQANDIIKRMQNRSWGWFVPGVKGNWWNSLPKNEQEEFRVLDDFIQDKVVKLINISNELGKL